MRKRFHSSRPAAPAPTTTNTRRPARWRIAAGLAVFALAFAALQATRYTRLSATWDEPIHLTAGYAALTQRDFRIDPSHPPLVRAWAALPLLALPHQPLNTSVIDASSVGEWLPGGYDLARQFLYTDNDADRLLYAARFMIVLGGIALGFLLFAWAYEWLGLEAAILALFVYAIEPNLRAHSVLVTTDLAITCLVFGTVYFLWRLARRFAVRDLVAASTCFALAVIAKFSAVLLIPIVVTLLTVAVVRSSLTLRQATTVLVALTAAALFAIWAAYGFRYRPSASHTWLLTSAAWAGPAPWFAGLCAWIDRWHLLPNAFVQGFAFSVSSAQQLPAFLAGTVKSGGWWYYFPAAFALKTPIAIVALMGVGAVVTARRRAHIGALTPFFLFVPMAIWMAAAMASGVNLGVRHILPVYPFVLLLAVAGSTALWSRRLGRPVVVVALLLAGVETGRSFSHPLSFFNVIAGGPVNGYRYLADSNLAWGSNLKAVKRWMDANAVAEINLAYFGSADPAYYGIHATYLPVSTPFLRERMSRPRLPGYVVISGTVLSGVYLPEWWRHFYAGFRDQAPAAVVGNTTRIYWVERWPEPPVPLQNLESLEVLSEGLLFGLHWPEQAIVHYRQYLDRDPANARAWKGLSLALAQSGRIGEALEGSRRALALAPDDREAQRNVAILERAIPQASVARQ